MVNTLLSVASVFKTIGAVVLAILIFLVMITIHEFGHWIAGRILRFGINEFSVGFGPALFKHKSKKSGQLFAIRLIPLGGYCAFQNEDGLDEDKKKEEGKKENTAEAFPDFAEEKPRENIAETASLDTIILTPAPEEEDKEELEETFTEEVKEESSEKKEEDFFEEVAPSEEAQKGKKKRRTPAWKTQPDDGSFTRKAPWKRIIVLVAGAFMNYVLSLFMIIILFFAYGQRAVVINGVMATEDQEEAEYSFQAGDVLLRANGVNLYLTTDFARALNGKEKGELVKFRVSRDGEEKNITVKLRESVKVKNSSQLSSVWKALGVGIEEKEDGKYYMLGNTSYRFGFFETLGRSFVYSFKLAGSILKTIGELLTGKLGISAVGGPVTSISMTAKTAATSFRDFLEITALIGVNLAVFNLLPVPALDGSKVVFTVIEWIRGKPISRKVEAIIHAVGFVFLLGFAVLVDILQFV